MLPVPTTDCSVDLCPLYHLLVARRDITGVSLVLVAEIHVTFWQVQGMNWIEITKEVAGGCQHPRVIVHDPLLANKYKGHGTGLNSRAGVCSMICAGSPAPFGGCEECSLFLWRHLGFKSRCFSRANQGSCEPSR